MTQREKSQMRRIMELDSLRRQYAPGTKEYQQISNHIHYERIKFGKKKELNHGNV